MTDKQRKRYIQEVYELCGTDSVLIISQKGDLERVSCPFVVIPIRNVGELQKGLKYAVNAVKLSPGLIDVYIIKYKAYYYFNFRLLGLG
ncbi:MAG: hypothetical protein JRJ57_04650 [Deltaproteobacteria bacterium]|nr:hypothetical protein [Deltaproteobacteria bacterium]